MNASTLAKISSDAHVDEPHDLWFERMDKSMRDRAPRWIQANSDGGWSLVVDNNEIGWSGMTADDAQAKEDERIAAVSPDVRLEMMRTDNVNAEMIYPTIGLYAWNIADPEVGRASCAIYNDWILERLGGSPRLKVAAMVPTWSIEMALAEVQRLGAEPSVGGLLLPLVGTPEWNMPDWEPLWGAIAETGKPAVMHQGTGHDMIFYRGWGSPTVNLLATQSMAPRAAALLACSGVLERSPTLHVVLVEVNAGWIAWTNSTLDEYYGAHRHWTKPKLSEKPSHYIKNQVHATFQDDPVALHNIAITGSACLLWGNDYAPREHLSQLRQDPRQPVEGR
ncbi:MAG TPA: amidohydrolase family protein [Acidimicrobiales bacterium]|nr:amidohydrolase family protein [Acidimicrobiales bacterium]